MTCHLSLSMHFILQGQPQQHVHIYDQPLPPPPAPHVPGEYYHHQHQADHSPPTPIDIYEAPPQPTSQPQGQEEDISPDKGISEAMEDLRPKHLSPIEEMIPVELHQSPGASRHLVSKLSRSYDDIEMVRLEGVRCEMSSIGKLTEDEVFHDQNPLLTTDSET